MIGLLASAGPLAPQSLRLPQRGQRLAASGEPGRFHITSGSGPRRKAASPAASASLTMVAPAPAEEPGATNGAPEAQPQLPPQPSSSQSKPPPIFSDEWKEAGRKDMRSVRPHASSVADVAAATTLCRADRLPRHPPPTALACRCLTMSGGRCTAAAGGTCATWWACWTPTSLGGC